MSSRPSQVTVEKRYGVTIVRLLAKRVDPHNFEQLFNELSSLAETESDEPTKLLLNLSNVEYLYSTALSKLTVLQKSVKDSGGELRLSNLNPVILELFEATHLDKFFDISEDEQKAMENLW